MSELTDMTAFAAFLESNSPSDGGEKLGAAYRVLNYAEQAHAQTVDHLIDPLEPSEKVLDQLQHTAQVLNLFRILLDHEAADETRRSTLFTDLLSTLYNRLDIERHASTETTKWAAYRTLGDWAVQAAPH